MAIVQAVQTGDWSDTATWGGSLPGATDDVESNGFWVTIDQDVTVVSLTGTGGGFYVDEVAQRTITADVIAGSTHCITLSGVEDVVIVGDCSGSATVNSRHGVYAGAVFSGSIIINGDVLGTAGGGNQNKCGCRLEGAGVVTINGNCISSSTSGIAFIITGSPQITINGTIQGGTGRGFLWASAGSATAFLHINGEVIGGSGGYGEGLYVSNTGTHTLPVEIVGNVTGTDRYGFLLVGSGDIDVTIVGDIKGHSISGYGVYCTATGIVDITITGNLGESDFCPVYLFAPNTNLTVNGSVFGGSIGSASNERNSGLLLWGGIGQIIINGDVYGYDGPLSTLSTARPGGIFFYGDYSGSVVINGVVKGGTHAAAVGGRYGTTNTIHAQEIAGSDSATDDIDWYDPYGVVALDVYAGSITMGINGVLPHGDGMRLFIDESFANTFSGYDGPGGTLVEMGDCNPDHPIPADVRLDTDYNSGTLTGTLAVPLPEQVSSGVPTDDTTGTGVVTEAGVAALLVPLEDAIGEVHDKLIFQVPEGPAVVIPAPSEPTQTVAWCYCYDENGAPVAGVEIFIQLKSGGAVGSAYSLVIASGVSDADGIAAMEIPRGTSLKFTAWRSFVGVSCRQRQSNVYFSGVDADELQLPALLGSP